MEGTPFASDTRRKDHRSLGLRLSACPHLTRPLIKRIKSFGKFDLSSSALVQDFLLKLKTNEELAGRGNPDGR